MAKLYLALCASLLSLTLYAQIVREQTTPQTIASVVPGYSQVSTTNTVTVSYSPPTAPSQPTPVDEDTTTEGNGVYEYGSVLPVNFTQADGNYTTTSVGKVWTLRISIPNALSIGLTFTQFNLSPTAELYVYNDAKTVVNKGIKKEHFTSSDTVSISSMNGNAVILYVIEPNNFGTFQSTLTMWYSRYLFNGFE